MKKLVFAAPAMLLAFLSLSSATQAQEPVNPVGFTIACTIPSGQLTCNASVPLPAGKRIVIENISVRATAPSGQTIQLYTSTSSFNLPNGTIVARNYVVLTPANSGSLYHANHSVRTYSSPGASVSIHGQRIMSPAGAPGQIVYEVWFTGYLLP